MFGEAELSEHAWILTLASPLHQLHCVTLANGFLAFQFPPGDNNEAIVGLPAVNTCKAIRLPISRR